MIPTAGPGALQHARSVFISFYWTDGYLRRFLFIVPQMACPMRPSQSRQNPWPGRRQSSALLDGRAWLYSLSLSISIHIAVLRCWACKRPFQASSIDRGETNQVSAQKPSALSRELSDCTSIAASCVAEAMQRVSAVLLLAFAAVAGEGSNVSRENGNQALCEYANKRWAPSHHS